MISNFSFLSSRSSKIILIFKKITPALQLYCLKEPLNYRVILDWLLFSGMVWYIFAMSIITINDISAYMCGFFFGSRYINMQLDEQIRINLQRQLFGIFKSLICSRFLATEGLLRGVHRNLSREGEAHIFFTFHGVAQHLLGPGNHRFYWSRGLSLLGPSPPRPPCTPLNFSSQSWRVINRKRMFVIIVTVFCKNKI